MEPRAAARRADVDSRYHQMASSCPAAGQSCVVGNGDRSCQYTTWVDDCCMNNLNGSPSSDIRVKGVLCERQIKTCKPTDQAKTGGCNETPDILKEGKHCRANFNNFHTYDKNVDDDKTSRNDMNNDRLTETFYVIDGGGQGPCNDAEKGSIKLRSNCKNEHESVLRYKDKPEDSRLGRQRTSSKPENDCKNKEEEDTTQKTPTLKQRIQTNMRARSNQSKSKVRLEISVEDRNNSSNKPQTGHAQTAHEDHHVTEDKIHLRQKTAAAETPKHKPAVPHEPQLTNVYKVNTSISHSRLFEARDAGSKMMLRPSLHLGKRTARKTKASKNGENLGTIVPTSRRSSRGSSIGGAIFTRGRINAKLQGMMEGAAHLYDKRIAVSKKLLASSPLSNNVQRPPFEQHKSSVSNLLQRSISGVVNNPGNIVRSSFTSRYQPLEQAENRSDQRDGLSHSVVRSLPTIKSSKNLVGRQLVSLTPTSSTLVTNLKPLESKGADGNEGSHVKVRIHGGSEHEVTPKTEVVEKFGELRPLLVPLTKRGSSQLSLLKNRRKDLAKTTETFYNRMFEPITQAREYYAKECRDAFRNCRVPTLRKSPATITLPNSKRSQPALVLAQRSGSTVRLNRVMASASRPAISLSRATSFASNIRSRTNIADFGRVLQREETPNIRIDQHNVGTPRFQPWAPFDQVAVRRMKCYMLHKAMTQPPHQRLRMPTVEAQRRENDSARFSTDGDRESEQGSGDFVIAAFQRQVNRSVTSLLHLK